MKRDLINFQMRLILIFCSIILLSLIVTGYLIGSKIINETSAHQEEKVMDIANVMSRSSEVIDGLSMGTSGNKLQEYTLEVQKSTGVEYIVVMNKDSIRQSHPNESLIGKKFVGDDEEAAQKGESYISRANGTLGESLRAFVPVYDGEDQVGVVAVGTLYKNIQSIYDEGFKTSLLGIGLGLLLGIIGAIIIARKLKRILFGLEPEEIATLLLEREAVLESATEGIIAINAEREIVLANRSALLLFERAGFIGSPLGKKAESFVPAHPLIEILETGEIHHKQDRMLNGIDIVVNRVPVILNDRIVGALATFQDKTELLSLVDRLSGAEAFAETLRIQTHEFMNKLHVIGAMVQTKSYDDLQEYLDYISNIYQKDIGSVSRLVNDPIIAGFLLHKINGAREVGVHTELNGKNSLPRIAQIEKVDAVITIIGNLYDNAVEAVSDKDDKQIIINIEYKNEMFYFNIKDNGPNVLTEELNIVLSKGHSTKGKNRGYGLYLIQQKLVYLGGSIEVVTGENQGLEFKVMIPYEGDADD